MHRNKAHECRKDVFLYLFVCNMLIINDCMADEHNKVSLWEGPPLPLPLKGNHTSSLITLTLL